MSNIRDIERFLLSSESPNLIQQINSLSMILRSQNDIIIPSEKRKVENEIIFEQAERKLMGSSCKRMLQEPLKISSGQSLSHLESIFTFENLTKSLSNFSSFLFDDEENVESNKSKRNDGNHLIEREKQFATSNASLPLSSAYKRMREDVDDYQSNKRSRGDDRHAQTTTNTSAKITMMSGFKRGEASRGIEVESDEENYLHGKVEEKKDSFVTASHQSYINSMKKQENSNNYSSSSKSNVPAQKRLGGQSRAFKPPSKTDGAPLEGDKVAKMVSNKIFNKEKDANGSSNETWPDGESIPESLKHVDYKLVQMIQSEMMDSGLDISWDQIAGLSFAKQCVQESVVFPILNPKLFTGLRTLPKGILFFGPPGTGKTLIGKAIASQSKAAFFSISASSLTSKWAGEGEKLVKVLFALAATKEPAVIFIDEIDSLLSQRTEGDFEASRRIKTEFLVQLDGVGTKEAARVIVIGATNRPQEIDEAARRRFVKKLYIPLPEAKARKQLALNLLNKNNHIISDENIETIVKNTKGYSGADIHNLFSEAAMGPVREVSSRGSAFDSVQGIAALSVDDLREIKNVNPLMLSLLSSYCRPIMFSDFELAFRTVKSSVSPSEITNYVNWNKQFGSWEEVKEDEEERGI